MSKLTDIIGYKIKLQESTLSVGVKKKLLVTEDVTGLVSSISLIHMNHGVRKV